MAARREKARATVRRAGAAIKRAAKKVTTKLRPRRRTTKKTEEPVAARAAKRATPKVKTARAVSRPVKRPADVPIDEISRAYAPKQTSLKASFRASGAERQRDQDVPGEHWNDEDHYTNKSGDPRIGTHGRAYEPGERR
jgi:hypothetical protein